MALSVLSCSFYLLAIKELLLFLLGCLKAAASVVEDPTPHRANRTDAATQAFADLYLETLMGFTAVSQ
jgi:hypothetical protein